MGVRSTRTGIATRLALVAVLLVTIAAGCGSSSKSGSSDLTTNTIDAGQVNLQLPPGWTVTKGGKGAVRPASDSAASGSLTGSASGATDSTGDTVPLASEDPQTKFFASVSTFSTCLKGQGVKFIGAPDPSNPSSPANDPTYLKSLGTCAAKSNILQALKDYGTFQDNLTPAQIEVQNKGYLKWRDCMIARGWGIPEPKPDDKGRLFTISSSGGSSLGTITPPPGQDIVTSSDVQACAAQAAKEVPEASSTTTGG